MKPVIELFTKEGKPADVFACGECRRVKSTEAEAERCCEPLRCKVCGKESKYITCRECQSLQMAEREKEAFNRATKLTPEEYSGGVVYGSSKYDSVEEALEQCIEDGVECEDLPSHFCAIENMPMLVLSLEDVIERAWENSEGAEADLEPLDYLNTTALKKGIEEFNEANKDATVWIEDPSRRIVVSDEFKKKVFEEYMAS